MVELQAELGATHLPDLFEVEVTLSLGGGNLKGHFLFPDRILIGWKQKHMVVSGRT
jgi:hypothetical protein